MFELIDLSKKLPKAEYKKRLPSLRRRLLSLQQACWQADIPSIVVFEGWDTSGKGPCIRKFTERLEPRGFDLYHVTDQPRTYELDLPWMWRFWTEIPRYGKMAIFDRSWNRRTLVERVYGDADELRWRRALRDIGDFERMLADDGYILIKLYLHISKKEQKKRYDDWKKNPGKSWKSLEGVGQKPGHYDLFLPAIEELLQHTEAAWCPWTILPATDLRWVIVNVFETVIERLENGIKARGHSLPTLVDTDADTDDDAFDEVGDDVVEA